MAARRLTDLVVEEVALCRNPANPGARIMLFKRQDGKRPADKSTRNREATMPKGMLERVIAAVKSAIGNDTPQPFDPVANEIERETKALEAAVREVVEDESIANKTAALDALFEEYRGSLGENLPGAFEKALAQAVLDESEDDVNKEALTKSLGLKPDATDDEITKAIEEAQFGAAVAKMSAAHVQYMNHEGVKLPEGGKPAFAKLSEPDREKHMKAFPPAKKPKDDGNKDGTDPTEPDEDDAKKALAALPEPLRKQWDVMARDHEEVTKMREERDVAVIAKRLAPISKHLPGTVDEIAADLHALAKTDKAAAERMEKRYGVQAERLEKSGIFGERGSSADGITKAGDQIDKLAKELVSKGQGLDGKALRGSTHSEKMAVARTQIRSANPELTKEEERERASRTRAA
jgi:hypothetical protein